ncbi:MAG: hypothetical protein RI884_3167 [Pseudomonadota bacterium]
MTTLASKLLRIIGALALLAALAGCSAIKLGYNNLPELAWWWLDGYMDFNDAQRAPVKDELSRLHQWHRTNELPRYAELLARIERMAAADVTSEQVCKLAEEGRVRFLALAAQSEAAIATIAPTLTNEQLRHLTQRYERNDQDFRKDWVDLPLTERRDKQYKQFLERMEDAYGRLDDAQRSVLRQRIEASRFDPAQVLSEMRRRQADTLQVLRQLRGGGSGPEARLQVKALVDRGQFPPDAGARRYREAVTEDNCALVAAVHNATTPAQRQSAARRLRAYQRDLADLVAAR